MSNTFNGCIKFNCDLSSWNTSNVQFMEKTFYDCENFIGKGLEKWNVSNVENSEYMFYNCKKLKCDLSDWFISSVHYDNMYAMFDGCKKMTSPKWYRYKIKL